jgi:DNA-binding NarL/FixJ family response regulator
MQKDIRVLIVEDDPYARDLMALLLTRDWRTQVVGEVGRTIEVSTFLDEVDRPVDLIILDTEYPGGENWLFEITERIQSLPNPPKILYTATRADGDLIRRLSSIGFGGYILKGEILYALATAVRQAYIGKVVITPGVLRAIPRRAFPVDTVLMDGRKSSTGLTEREIDLVRLGIIFNLALRDIADELVLSPGWVSEIVSTIYKKLGMREILSGELPLDAYFEDEAVLARTRQILTRGPGTNGDRKIRKAPWMATLAFHLLTQPEVDEL